MFRAITITLTISALVACSSDKPPAVTTDGVSVTLLVAPQGGGLVTITTIVNGTAAPIFILDGLTGDRAIVSRGDAGTARLVFGFLDTDSQLPQVEQGVRERLPQVTRLEPAATRTRTVTLPLPLAPWHPYLEMASLKQPSRLVAEVGYLDAAPSDLLVVKTKQAWARSAPATLP